MKKPLKCFQQESELLFFKKFALVAKSILWEMRRITNENGDQFIQMGHL